MSEIKHLEWHLTPRGWQQGDVPADRVLTMRVEEGTASMECQEAWWCGSKERITQLIEKFGHAPQRNSSFPIKPAFPTLPRNAST